MTRVRVLVVEDDEGFQEVYKDFFERHAEEFTWVLAKAGNAAITALQDQSFDVALIDWLLKGGTIDGFQVLQAIQNNPKAMHLVSFMVTGNESERDIQAAIGAGADDYITKPFKMELLAARLRGRLAQAKKQAPVEKTVLELDGVRLIEAAWDAELDGVRLHLRRTECELLKLFLQRPGRVLTREFLWDAIRGYPSSTSENVLTKQISNLRTKLGAWGERLEARRGQGYVLNSRQPLSRD